MQSARVEEYVSDEYIKFVLKEPKAKLKIGGMKEALTEMLKKEQEYLEELASEHDDILPSLEAPTKKTIH